MQGWITGSALDSCDSYPAWEVDDAPGNMEKNTMEEVFRSLGLRQPPGRRKPLTFLTFCRLEKFWIQLLRSYCHYFRWSYDSFFIANSGQ